MTENTNTEMATTEENQESVVEQPVQKATQKKVYQFDTFGKFVTEVRLYESYPGANDFGLVINSTELAPPNPHMVFDGEAWVESGDQYKIAVEAAKEEKRALLNEVRNQKMAFGFEFDGKQYDSDAASVQKINGASTMALIAKMQDQPFGMKWTAKDNTEIEFDAEGMIALGVACASHVDQLHHQCVSLKNEMMTLDSLEDIANFSW